jgi:DNA-binding IclR family transcriptional regulator
LDELAKLYHDKGLTVTEISAQLRVPRTTVHDAVLRLKACELGKGGLK